MTSDRATRFVDQADQSLLGVIGIKRGKGSCSVGLNSGRAVSRRLCYRPTILFAQSASCATFREPIRWVTTTMW